jgi:ABC-type transport system involved in multi-copper enzyme maturation permease subunit
MSPRQAALPRLPAHPLDELHFTENEKRAMRISFFGPLAALECRRALVRPWVFWVRGLTTLLAALVLTAVFWYWWFNVRMSVANEGRPDSPSPALRSALLVLETILITTSIVLAPAVLAGTLAGEKTRNTLGLLLACRVSPREIVVGRASGQLSIVAVVLIGALPAAALLSGFLALPLATQVTLVITPAAIAFGGGGLAIAASAVARRGRDALLAVYLLELLLLLMPTFATLLPARVQDFLEMVGPYHGVGTLIDNSDPLPALTTAAIWATLGLAGIAYATWQLRPAFLRDRHKRLSRRWFGRRTVPPVSNRPILWKELHIEQLGLLNRFVRWLAILIVGTFSIVSLVLAGLYYWELFAGSERGELDWALSRLQVWMRGSSTISWLLQWTLGLRAAVAVAAERERGTWDGILLSPLEGRDIVIGKIYGTLYSLRWFVAMVFLAWTAGAVTGALSLREYLTLVADMLFIGMFIVAVGVLFSLNCANATRAMTLTLVTWLGAIPATAIVAFSLTALAGLFLLLLGLYWDPPAVLSGASTVLYINWFELGYTTTRLLCYSVLAFLISSYCRRYFDRLAGRATASPRVRGRLRVAASRPRK